MDADLDALVTALYVKIDDMLVKDHRPGHPVRPSQSELICLAVAQALLGFHSEHRWIRLAICHLRSCFPYLPHQPGYNKLRVALPLVKQTTGTARAIPAGPGDCGLYLMGENLRRRRPPALRER